VSVLTSSLTKEEEVILSFVEAVYKKVMAEFKIDFDGNKKPQQAHKHQLDNWLSKR